MKKKILFGLLLLINLSLFAQKINDYSFVYPSMLDMMLGSASEDRGLPDQETSFKTLSDPDNIKDGVKMTECYISGSKINMTFIVESEPIIFELIYKDTGDGNNTAYLIKLTLYAAKKVKDSYQKSTQLGNFTEPAGDLFSNPRGYGQFYGAANEAYGLIYDWGKKAKLERKRNEEKVSQLELKISTNLKEFSKKHKTAMLAAIKKNIYDSIIPYVLSEGVFDNDGFLAFDKSESKKTYYEYKDKFATSYIKDIEDYKKAVETIESTEKNFWDEEFNYDDIISSLSNEVFEEQKDGVISQIELRNKIYVDIFAQKGKACIDSVIPEFDSTQTTFDSDSFVTKLNDKLKSEYESLETEYASKAYLKALKFKSLEEIYGDIKISELIKSVENTFVLRDLSYDSFVDNIKNNLIKQSCLLCKNTKNQTTESIMADLKDFEQNELKKATSEFQENNTWNIHFKSYESISDKIFNDEILGIYCEIDKKGFLKLTKQGNAELKKK